MIELTKAQWDRMGAQAVYDLRKTCKESVGLLNEKGQVSMYLAYQPPTPPCSCEPEDRMGVCLMCDGYV